MKYQLNHVTLKLLSIFLCHNNELGFRFNNLPMEHLGLHGFLLIHKGPNFPYPHRACVVFICMSITSKSLWHEIRNKIERWQIRYLLVAGRVTLIKSTTNTILIYSIQTTLLPETTCKEINRINLNFCGETTHHRTCHTISWEVITEPKEAGD